MNEPDLAYLAGIIDGEGSITAYLIPPPAESAGSPRTNGRLVIANTNHHLADWLFARFGGYCRVRTWKRGKPCFFWHISLQQAASLLRLALPYLILKREQAELLIELAELAMPTNAQRWNGVPPENLERRIEIVADLKLLNARWAGVSRTAREVGSQSYRPGTLREELPWYQEDWHR